MAWVTPINWLAKAVGYDVTRADMQTISDSLTYLKNPQITSATTTVSVTITSTNVAVPTNVLALPSATYDGTSVRFELSADTLSMIPNAAGDYVYLNLWDDVLATNLGTIARLTGVVAAATQQIPLFIRFVMTPAAGAHTYSVRGYKLAAGDTVAVGASVAVPMYFTATYI